MGTRIRQVWARLWQQGLEFKSYGGWMLGRKGLSLLAAWLLGEKGGTKWIFSGLCVEERYTEAIGGRGAKNGGAKRGAK